MPERLQNTAGPCSVLLIRLMVGLVFLSEGLQKFLLQAEVLAGLFTRLAVLPLLTVMAVAVWTPKVPILLAQGFWKMAHEARTDFSMIMGSLFLLAAGAGACSLDSRLNRRRGL